MDAARPDFSFSLLDAVHNQYELLRHAIGPAFLYSFPLPRPDGAGPAIAQGCATAHRHTGTAGARPGTRDPLGLAASCEFTYPSNAPLL